MTLAYGMTDVKSGNTQPKDCTCPKDASAQTVGCHPRRRVKFLWLIKNERS